MVQARVTDEQWNYLYGRAVEFHDGDLSQALREAITFSEELVRVLEAPSPPDAIREMLKRWEGRYNESRFDVYMDEADE